MSWLGPASKRKENERVGLHKRMDRRLAARQAAVGGREVERANEALVERKVQERDRVTVFPIYNTRQGDPVSIPSRVGSS